MIGWLRGGIEERLAFMAPTRRLRLRLVLRTLEREDTTPDARVFDAGCGDGLLTLAMARAHPGWRLIAGDLRDDLLAAGRARASARRLLNVDFVCTDLTQPIGMGPFDVIVATECLSEIRDDCQALRMLTAALLPGGLLAVHVPEQSWKPVFRWSSPVWRHEVRHGYAPEEMRARLQGLGFQDVAVAITQRGTVTAAQEIRDGTKQAPIWVRVLLYPLMVLAVRMEELGMTWGPPRALLITGRRSPE
jgi:SAM-dependent methyltransferase